MLLSFDDTARLRAALERAGYTVDAVQALLDPVAAAAMARGEYLPALRATAGGTPLETLVRLFLLGSTEPADAVRAALDPLPLPAARTAGLVEPADGGVRAGLDLRPYADGAGCWWVVSDLGTDVRPGSLRRDHVLGIGGASVTLARVTVRPEVASALDVGTGCGVQALHLSRHARQVTATDRNARALALARLTAALNGLDWELVEGDLLEPVAGRRFDLVVSNPPFVIGEPDATRYLYRDSGLAGDEVCRRLVAEVPAVLAEGGWGQLLVNWLHVAGRDWTERVAGWVRPTGCDAWVVQREVLDPAEYVELWLRDSGDAGQVAYAQRWLDWFAAERVEAVGFGLVSLHRSGAAEPVVRVEDLAELPELPAGDEVLGWFRRQDWLRHADLLWARLVAAPDLRLEQIAQRGDEGWDVAVRWLARGGLREQVDEVAAALVAGCTGATRLGDLLAVLAAAYRVDGDALTAAALPVVAHLVERGMLRPPT